MLGALLTFDGLPQIGFAHHFYMENYCQSYKIADRSFELVYVKAGGITAEVYGQAFQVHPGSLLVLFRHLPIRLTSADGAPQAHCSVQLKMDYRFTLLETASDLPEGFDGLALPFVMPQGAETEAMKKELYAIVSTLGIARDKYRLSASLAACGILARLDRLYRQKLHTGRGASSLLEYKIKRYVAENIHRSIPLSDLAAALDKTPNYLNSVFKAASGISIHQYIAREKVRLIGELMEGKGLSFQTACENVAIEDISYGYRLFKKHMGVTPRAYLSSEKHRV